MTTKLADVLVRAILTFDPSQHRTRDEEVLQAKTSAAVVGVLRAYLTANECTWLYRRRTGTEIRSILHTSSVILYGEAGTGKTSILREMLCSSGATSNSVPLLILDLHLVEGQVRAAAKRASKRRILTEFTISRLNMQLARDINDAEVQLTLMQRLATGNEHFLRLRSALRKANRSTDLSDRSAARKLFSEEFFLALYEQCFDIYMDKETELSQNIRELAALAETPNRPAIVIAFDNVDRLDEYGQLEVAEIARSVSAGADTLLPVILTCRNKNLPKLQDVIDTLVAQPFAAQAMPDATVVRDGFPKRWAVAGILRRRLDVLRDDLLWKEIARVHPDSINIRAEVDLVLRRVDQVLNTLWPLDANSSVPDHSIELGIALTKWHKGNIRDISSSLYTIVRQITVDPALMPSSAGDVAGKRVRNLLYRHMLGQTSRSGSLDGAYMGDIDGLLQLFEAHPQPVSGSNLPFYFLKFRVLRYMAARPVGMQFTRQEISRRMAYYGVDESSADGVLSELIAGSPSTASLVLEQRGRRGGSRIEILDNGRYLVTSLVTKCEYLYASGISIPSVYAHLEATDLFPRFARTVKRQPSDEQKVLASSVFLLDYLLPRLEDEHPYLTRDTFDRSERERVQRFRADFGYDKNNWFINQLVASIESHAKNTGVTIPKAIKSQLDGVLVQGSRLDRMLAEPTLRDASAG